MTDNDHPNAGSYLDRHGKRRWRFRRGKKTVALPGEPGEPAFEAAYQAALEGRKPQPATVHRLPTAASPHSLRAAWRILRSDTLEWKTLGPSIKTAQTAIAERFLTTPVVEGEALTFGDCDVAHLKRKHIKALLARRSDTPHAAAHLLRVIRKLTGVALDQEWIEHDPTYRLKFRPEYKGWKAWPAPMLDKFEQHWAVGTTPRLVYSLALYFGHRRSDVTQVRWADLEVAATNVVQQKTGKPLWIPMHANLAEVIAAAPRSGDHVVMTQWGKPFSAKALGMRMQKWTAAAGIPPGHTLHGLRKTLGKALAENSATTRQIMGILGHDDIQHAELYTREAEQRGLAADGMEKLVDWRKKPVG
jgi:site-specific recombinase XerC